MQPVKSTLIKARQYCYVPRKKICLEVHVYWNHPGCPSVYINYWQLCGSLSFAVLFLKFQNFKLKQFADDILTLSQTMNFRPFQTEIFFRRQFHIGRKWQKVLQTGRKHCGKRRNCSLRAISPFPTVFSKDLYCRHVKTRACLGKG